MMAPYSRGPPAPPAELGAAPRRPGTGKCRCRFPGCESRRVDLHHIQYWSNGGRTKLANLISLCKYHHLLVHERGYLIAARPRTARSPSPGRMAGLSSGEPCAAGRGRKEIEGCHDADITSGRDQAAGHAERLDLDHAIYVCFANARTPQERRDQRDQAEDSGLFRPTKWVVEMSDWVQRIREHTAA